MAASLVAVLPVLVLYVFAQRYFVAGIATTGIR
jgi:multiple sugar transport system permease protein